MFLYFTIYSVPVTATQWPLIEWHGLLWFSPMRETIITKKPAFTEIKLLLQQKEKASLITWTWENMPVHSMCKSNVGKQLYSVGYLLCLQISSYLKKTKKNVWSTNCNSCNSWDIGLFALGKQNHLFFAITFDLLVWAAF